MGFFCVFPFATVTRSRVLFYSTEQSFFSQLCLQSGGSDRAREHVLLRERQHCSSLHTRMNGIGKQSPRANLREKPWLAQPLQFHCKIIAQGRGKSSFSARDSRITGISIESCAKKDEKDKVIEMLTWLPNTPAAQAVETSSEPNHTAASLGGMPRVNIWESFLNYDGRIAQMTWDSLWSLINHGRDGVLGRDAQSEHLRRTWLSLNYVLFKQFENH